MKNPVEKIRENSSQFDTKSAMENDPDVKNEKSSEDMVTGDFEKGSRDTLKLSFKNLKSLIFHIPSE